MQKHLVIFDDYINIESLFKIANFTHADKADLFPLTSDTAIIEKLKFIFDSKDLAYSFVDSANLVNDEVSGLKESICHWSYALGEEIVYRKKVKELFLFDKNNASSWWFSLISEKNTVKTDAYLKISQYHAIRTLITKDDYVKVYIGVSDPRLRKAIIIFLNKRRGLSYKTVDLNYPAVLISIKYLLAIPVFFLKAILLASRFIHRCLLSKFMLSALKSRLPTKDSLLWVTYFPMLDRAAAENGIFVDNYAPRLQEKIKELSIPIARLFMFVPFNGFTYRESLYLAARLSQNGEKIFFIEEFVTYIDILKVVFTWIGQAIKSLVVLPKLKKTIFSADPVGIECSGFMEWLWIESFCGQSTIEGIFDYFCYQNVFKNVPHLKACLYYCEMLAWEKALNAAKMQFAPQIRSIGFQHAIVPENLFNYFHDSREIIRGGPQYLPQPDVFACNGKFTCSALKWSGFDNLTMVEAARHTWIEDVLKRPGSKNRGKPVLIVIGSIDKEETLSLVRLLYHAFPNATSDFEIWLKSHPCLDLKAIFHGLGINPLQSGYKICDSSISDCFSSASIALVPSSSVALEATVFGCEVIVPIFVDSIIMNPLLDFNLPCHVVTTPRDLKRIIYEKIVSGKNQINVDKEAVKGYWEIDSSLGKWEKLLNSVYEHSE